MGTGFDLVQRAWMKVLLVPNEFSQNPSPVEVRKHRLLYNQRSRPLVARRENAALTHEASTSIQPEESPPGGQERECSSNT